MERHTPHISIYSNFSMGTNPLVQGLRILITLYDLKGSKPRGVLLENHLTEHGLKMPSLWGIFYRDCSFFYNRCKPPSGNLLLIRTDPVVGHLKAKLVWLKQTIIKFLLICPHPQLQRTKRQWKLAMYRSPSLHKITGNLFRFEIWHPFVMLSKGETIMCCRQFNIK